jgi:hypothetical protein
VTALPVAFVVLLFSPSRDEYRLGVGRRSNGSERESLVRLYSIDLCIKWF